MPDDKAGGAAGGHGGAIGGGGEGGVESAVADGGHAQRAGCDRRNAAVGAVTREPQRAGTGFCQAVDG